MPTSSAAAIVVRTARAGERIRGVERRKLRRSIRRTLLITDPSGPIAIAGVIGGADTAISDATTRIVLESACFNASSIRKTSSRLKLRTDASMRFEKAQDPANTVRGLRRALELLRTSLAGHPTGRRPGRRLSPVARAAADRTCRSIGWIANWAARFPPAKCGKFSNRWNFE